MAIVSKCFPELISVVKFIQSLIQNQCWNQLAYWPTHVRWTNKGELCWVCWYRFQSLCFLKIGVAHFTRISCIWLKLVLCKNIIEAKIFSKEKSALDCFCSQKMTSFTIIKCVALKTCYFKIYKIGAPFRVFLIVLIFISSMEYLMWNFLVHHHVMRWNISLFLLWMP